MKTTLEAQKQRLLKELEDARYQISQIKAEPFPDFKIINYYMDIIARDTQLIEMIDSHIFGDRVERSATFPH